MRILQVALPVPMGGADRVVEALAVGLRRRGHDVALAGLVFEGVGEPPLFAPLRTAGVDVHAVPVTGRGYLEERAAVRALCRSLRPDVVHTHGYRPDVVDGGVARSLDIPVVATAHGFTGSDWRNRLYESLQRRAWRRYDAVVAVSRPLAERLARAGIPAGRIHLVCNAWTRGAVALSRAEARRALGIREGARVVGWVGRFSAEKGPDVLVRALAALDDGQVAAAMLGTGPSLEPVRALAGRLGVASRLQLPGAVPDAARLLAAFDAVVLSSRTEGTPIVLLEAMAAGVPVIAARVGGVPDVVGPAEALLVPPEDPAALAAGIRAVLADPSGSAARADAARRRLAADFAEGPWLDRYLEVYEAAMRGRTERSGAERS